MSYVNNSLWKPDKKDVIAPDTKKGRKNKKKRNKRNKDKERQKRQRIRDDLLKHFELNKYATNMAICFQIHKKTEHPLPGNDRQIYQAMAMYWHVIQGDPWAKRKMMTPDNFYNSKRWRELRYIALQQSGGCCTLCGATAKDGVQLHVDHIVPRSRNISLQYDLDNLQILCSDCNLGKSNYDDTDFR